MSNETKKKYDAETGMRMTDCCGAMSTYDENGSLHCKECYEEVADGQGDGDEYRWSGPARQHQRIVDDRMDQVHDLQVTLKAAERKAITLGATLPGPRNPYTSDKEAEAYEALREILKDALIVSRLELRLDHARRKVDRHYR